jgi:glycerol-3-phosphate dehydrogenase (NAD(P)+)
LALNLGARTPISDAVAAILGGEIGVDAAITGLLARPLKSED